MHPAAFEPRLDHQFVGAFHHPAANRPALRLVGRILHLPDPLGQIGQIGRHHVAAWVGHLVLQEFGQHGPRPAVLQGVTLLLRPLLGLRAALAPHRVADLAKALGGMRKVQNPQRVRTVQVQKALDPFRPVGHGGHRPGRQHAAPMDFTERQVAKACRHPPGARSSSARRRGRHRRPRAAARQWPAS